MIRNSAEVSGSAADQPRLEVACWSSLQAGVTRGPRGLRRRLKQGCQAQTTNIDQAGPSSSRAGEQRRESSPVHLSPN